VSQLRRLTRRHWCSVDGEHSLASDRSARYGQTAPSRAGITTNRRADQQSCVIAHKTREPRGRSPAATTSSALRARSPVSTARASS
jgi:hypothetical protein